MGDLRRATYRLPADAIDFIEREARRNLTTMNAEVLRAIRERMHRDDKAATGEKFGDPTPAAVHHDTALAGGPATR